MYGQPLGTWLKHSVDTVPLRVCVGAAVGPASCPAVESADADIDIAEEDETSGSVKPGLSGGSSLSPSSAACIAGVRGNCGGCQVEVPSTVLFHRGICAVVVRLCIVGAAVT